VRAAEGCLTPLSVCHPVCIYPLPPSQPPFPMLSPQGTPETPVQHQPKSHCTALHLAPGRSGGAAARPWARGKSRGRAVAAGGWRWGGWRVCSRGAGAKCRLKFLYVRHAQGILMKTLMEDYGLSKVSVYRYLRMPLTAGATIM